MMILLTDTAQHPYFPPVHVAEATKAPVRADSRTARGKGPRGSAHYTREAPRPAILARRGVRPGGETVRRAAFGGASLDGTPRLD
jgi:hypothetical protein